MFNSLLTHTPLLYLVQSLWRDEAFSILAAKESLGFIATRLGFEPPVYYTLLHFWMRIFGETEIAARSLSVLGFVLATVIVIEWSDVRHKHHWLSWYTPLFFFLNPMLLYYAFEVRTYAWYTFFSTALLVAYISKQWRWVIAAATLGFYTHVYLFPFIGILALHWVWTHIAPILGKPNMLKKIWSFAVKDQGMRSFFTIALLITPWLIKIGIEAARMKSSWYFPVDWQLVKAALGNMFVGYEGTPWYGWKYTPYLSLGIIGSAAYALRDTKYRDQTKLLMLFGIVPLAAIIGISFIKPLFVNRYLIPTTIAEVLIVTAALGAVRTPWIQKTIAALLLSFVLWFNWWYPPYHAKPPVKNTFDQIKTLINDRDIVLAENPMIYLEALYYAPNRSRVFLYNPDNNVFPWYIGDALITPSRMVRDFPAYPIRAFVIHTDATFDVTYRMPL